MTAASISSNDLREVYEATYEAREKWANVLLALDVTNPTIESIRSKFHGNPDDCYRQGLSQWLQEGDKSWNDVARAMSSPTVGHKDIAGAISKSHLSAQSKSESLHAARVIGIIFRNSAAIMQQLAPTQLAKHAIIHF